MLKNREFLKEIVFNEKRYNLLLTDAKQSDNINFVAEMTREYNTILLKKKLSYVNK